MPPLVFRPPVIVTAKPVRAGEDFDKGVSGGRGGSARHVVAGQRRAWLTDGRFAGQNKSYTT